MNEYHIERIKKIATGVTNSIKFDLEFTISQYAVIIRSNEFVGHSVLLRIQARLENQNYTVVPDFTGGLNSRTGRLVRGLRVFME